MTTLTRIFDFAYYQLEEFNKPDFLNTKREGEWIKTSSEDYVKNSNKVSRGLIRLGVEKNDKIAVISSTNRTEWHILDIGLLQLGAQNVPIYPTISKEDYEYILNHSESKYCFVSDVEVLEKVKAIQANVPSLKGVYTFDEIEGAKNWKEILELGEDDSNQDVVESRKNEVKPEDLATIIYTSGTTGVPKGVMLSHNNIVTNVIASAKRIPMNNESKVLSLLPVCHIFERMAIYIYHHLGLSIYFAESLEKSIENLREVKADMMAVVPRLIEKIYDSIYVK